MKNIWFIVAGVFLIVVILVATLLHNPNASPSPETVVETAPTGTSDETEPDEQPVAANIRVTSPAVNAVITSPFMLTGEARVFENTVNYRLRDEAENVIAEGFTTALSPDLGQFGLFTQEIGFTDPRGDTGTLEVFTYSAKDGSEIEKVRIPVRFSEDATTDVQVYFGNTQKDPQTEFCELTYRVDREVPATPAIGKAALDELLKGPNTAEKKVGYFSSINTDAKVVSLVIEHGIATVTFNSAFQRNMAGSCKVSAVRAQIESTLKQFPSVQQVVIKVDGVPDEEVLQP